jgi:hypothetical protein
MLEILAAKSWPINRPVAEALMNEVRIPYFCW